VTDFGVVLPLVVPFNLLLCLSVYTLSRSSMLCSSILTLLGSGHQNLHEIYQCLMYSGKLLMIGKEDA
jgi:hypothetical protein